MKGLVLLAAGGTGGHLFPAEALGLTLAARGWNVHLATDRRIESYGRDFPAEQIHFIRSATLSGSRLESAGALIALVAGYLQARRLIGRLKPAAAVGFGGYPTVPPILAAVSARVPTVVHEQNAVLGRANKFLAPRVTRLATSFAEVGGAEGMKGKVVQTGNPVRPAVIAAAATPYPIRTADEPFRLTVFGGSQGAQFLSDVVPAAIAMLTRDMQGRLRITQQCRPEDLGRVRQAYELLRVEAELQSFFTDMPKKIAASHLVVSRSGASTCAELAVIARPAIMVPLPHAIDQDQRANAEVLAAAGGGWMIPQADLTPQRLAAELERFARAPDRLAEASAAARSVSRPDAVDRLADLVEKVAA